MKQKIDFEKIFNYSIGCVGMVGVLATVVTLFVTIKNPTVVIQFLEQVSNLATSTPIVVQILPKTNDSIYTPYPIPSLQTADTQPTVSEPKLIYDDNFDNGINRAYWREYGVWSISDRSPILVTEYPYDSSALSSSPPFGGIGGLVFPGIATYDRFAVEFDFDGTRGYDYYGPSGLLGILFSYKDGNNYKRLNLTDYGTCSLTFILSGKVTEIPTSDKICNIHEQNHLRAEIRGNSFKLLINDQSVYDFTDLPDSLTGALAILGNRGKLVFSKFKIYQLP